MQNTNCQEVSNICSLYSENGPIKHFMHQQLLESSSMTAYRSMISKDWKKYYVSENIEDLTGWPASDFMSGKKEFCDLFPYSELESVQEQYARQLKENGSYNIEAKIQTRDGEIKWIRDRGTKFSDKNGEKFIDGIIIDISKEIELRIQYTRALRQLEQHTSMSERTLKLISHELRTPLNAVYGFAQILLDANSNQTISEVRSELEFIIEGAYQLKTLSDSVISSLDISNYIDIDRKPISLLSKFEHVLEDIGLNDREQLQPCKFEIDTIALSQTIIIAQKQLVRIVLGEIIQNSMQHGAGKKIEISARQNSDRGVDIIIDDDGAGVEKDEIQSIFQPFRKSLYTELKAYRGLGLGLYRVIQAATLIPAEVYAGDSPSGGFRLVFRINEESVLSAPANLSNIDTRSLTHIRPQLQTEGTLYL